MNKNDHILVTGASGFLGSHLLPLLRDRYPSIKITAVSSKDCDLLDPFQTNKLFKELKPTHVCHLAAKPGGIEANRKYQADFFHQNLFLTENVFHAAATNGVKKLIFPIGGCSYPDSAVSPIKENQMWNGLPTETSLGYSMAKKIGIIAAFAYKQQYGLNSVILVPGNMYGEYDNFREGESHVIPSLIRRFYNALKNNMPSVTIWGTGKPTRDFVYAGDVASVFPFFLENDIEPGPVNISSGSITSIRDLALKIAELIGYKGDIIWDIEKPDGQMNKVFDVAKLKSLGLRCPTTLDEGLKRTIQWFTTNYNKPGAIRL